MSVDPQSLKKKLAKTGHPGQCAVLSSLLQYIINRTKRDSSNQGKKEESSRVQNDKIKHRTQKSATSKNIRGPSRFQLIQSKFMNPNHEPPMKRQREVGKLAIKDKPFSNRGSASSLIHKFESSKVKKLNKEGEEFPMHGDKAKWNKYAARNTVKNILQKFVVVEEKENKDKSPSIRLNKAKSNSPKILNRNTLFSVLKEKFEQNPAICSVKEIKSSLVTKDKNVKRTSPASKEIRHVEAQVLQITSMAVTCFNLPILQQASLMDEPMPAITVASVIVCPLSWAVCNSVKSQSLTQNRDHDKSVYKERLMEECTNNSTKQGIFIKSDRPIDVTNESLSNDTKIINVADIADENEINGLENKLKLPGKADELPNYHLNMSISKLPHTEEKVTTKEKVTDFPVKTAVPGNSSEVGIIQLRFADKQEKVDNVSNKTISYKEHQKRKDSTQQGICAVTADEICWEENLGNKLLETSTSNPMNGYSKHKEWNKDGNEVKQVMVDNEHISNTDNKLTKNSPSKLPHCTILEEIKSSEGFDEMPESTESEDNNLRQEIMSLANPLPNETKIHGALSITGDSNGDSQNNTPTFPPYKNEINLDSKTGNNTMPIKIGTKGEFLLGNLQATSQRGHLNSALENGSNNNLGVKVDVKYAIRCVVPEIAPEHIEVREIPSICNLITESISTTEPGSPYPTEQALCKLPVFYEKNAHVLNTAADMEHIPLPLVDTHRKHLKNNSDSVVETFEDPCRQKPKPQEEHRKHSETAVHKKEEFLEARDQNNLYKQKPPSQEGERMKAKAVVHTKAEIATARKEAPATEEVQKRNSGSVVCKKSELEESVSQTNNSQQMPTLKEGQRRKSAGVVHKKTVQQGPKDPNVFCQQKPSLEEELRRKSEALVQLQSEKQTFFCQETPHLGQRRKSEDMVHKNTEPLEPIEQEMCLQQKLTPVEGQNIHSGVLVHTKAELLNKGDMVQSIYQGNSYNPTSQKMDSKYKIPSPKDLPNKNKSLMCADLSKYKVQSYKNNEMASKQSFKPLVVKASDTFKRYT